MNKVNGILLLIGSVFIGAMSTFFVLRLWFPPEQTAVVEAACPVMQNTRTLPRLDLRFEEPQEVKNKVFEEQQSLALHCAAFEQAKRIYTFDPRYAMTWDNAYPSREDYVRRLNVFKDALREEWVTYVNTSFGFSFEYPPSWNVFASADGSELIVAIPGEQVVRPMVISVNDRKLFALNKTNIQEMVGKPDLFGRYMYINTDYGTFMYHNFYRHAAFYFGDTIYRVFQPLSVVTPDIAGYTREQAAILEKINAGNIDELVKLEIQFTDRVVYSFHPLEKEEIFVEQK